VEITKALGMGLDKKAVAAVKEYRFEPGTRNGKPVAVSVHIEVNFKIY
jgi:periplasmic protein TonB